MPDQDPFAAIAKPIVAPKANPDPYASIAKPIDPYASIAKPINFDDLGGRRVSAPTSRPVGAHPSGGIDFSDLGGRRVTPTEDPFAGIAKPIEDPFASIAKPIDGSSQEPQATGPLHQIGGFLQGAGENIGGAIESVHNLFRGPQNDEENAVQRKVMVGEHGELGGRLALAGYRFLHGVNDTLNQSDAAGRAGAKEAKESGSAKAGLLTDMENEPFIGNATKLAEHGEYGKALGDLLTTVLTMRGGARGAGEAAEDVSKLPQSLNGEARAGASIPKPTFVAGTKLPETAGQAASRVNPTGLGSDVKGIEDISRRLPGSGRLREISNNQQAAAREVLANKATSATGAATSTSAEAIEQNAANAAESARQAGSAKYEEIGKAASSADLSGPVGVAHTILQDDSLAKVLPKSTRDALGKVASSLTEREGLSRQIYGKGFGDLDATQQAEVGKALVSGGDEPAGFRALLKARSELGSAANSARDAADARQLHLAHEEFGQAVKDTLGAHDAANGTDLTSSLGEADKLWSQKFAFEKFTNGLQDIMRDQPHTGARQINGAAFQKFINDLDPHGAKGKTDLQKMFPNDPQSVKDIHDLADFMGRNQASAGSMASGMAKLRMLGLKESAIGLIANNFGFSYVLSKPGLARALYGVNIWEKYRQSQCCSR